MHKYYCEQPKSKCLILCAALPSHLYTDSSNLGQYGDSTEKQSLTLFFLPAPALAFPCGHKQSHGILQTTLLCQMGINHCSEGWNRPNVTENSTRSPNQTASCSTSLFTNFHFKHAFSYYLFHGLFDCLITNNTPTHTKKWVNSWCDPLRVVC